jgi:two-component system, chemotaxis family, response regulator WspF
MMAAEAVRRVVLSTGAHQVAWIAHDGAEAVRLCAADTPDLILMDLIMPKMDGVEATRQIMAATPCAIVAVTASVAANSSRVFEAMGVGALDAVNTPVLERPDAEEGAKALLAKIETIRKLIGPAGPQKNFSADEKAPGAPVHSNSCLVAFGASAGGPAALAAVLSGLPSDFPAPIAIVQHVDEQFASGLADWLDGQTRLHVRLAQEGDRLEAGTALLAGRDSHLVFVSPTRLGYTRHPEDCSYRPSIDAFFKSAARFWHGDVIAALLTGMGRDGAEGLRDLRHHGHHTIAQDRATSAVYGMPKAAAELGAATDILALPEIGPRLREVLDQRIKLHG